MRFLPATVLVVVAVLVAGCGSKHTPSNGEAAKTPAQIAVDVLAATKDATAVHVSGSGTTGGSPLSLDLHLVAGTGGEGHITLSGLSFDIIRIGSKAYFKGGPAFLKHYGGTVAAQLFKGKWFVAPADSGDFASFTPLTDLAQLTQAIVSSHGKLAKGAETTINGQPAIAIDDTTQGGTLYVATTGKAYPLELKAGSGNTGTIDFTDWDQPETLTAPKGAIDYSKLTASG